MAQVLQGILKGIITRDKDGNLVQQKMAAAAVVGADGKTAQDHMGDGAAHLSEAERGYMTKAGTAGGLALLDENGHLPASAFDSTKIPVEQSVPNIPARDALTGQADGAKVFVEDAGADPLVGEGWAIYRYRAAVEAVGAEGEEGYVPGREAAWIKVAEAESLDVVLAWTNLVGKPASTSAQIDEAVAETGKARSKMVTAVPDVWPDDVAATGTLYLVDALPTA